MELTRELKSGYQPVISGIAAARGVKATSNITKSVGKDAMNLGKGIRDKKTQGMM
ncbi:MAG: hypothetical protein LBD41_01775 [Clostridiales Family XIII bacterium]|nr:hypothetical protein [Clostridiales Family XIII bacterium]